MDERRNEPAAERVDETVSTGREAKKGEFDPMDDPMAPPREPCECWCLHCNRTFMSSEMWFQRVVGAKDGFPGFWMCPTPNCDGGGFTIDIFPTDPDHPANDGWHECDEEEEFDEHELEPEEIEAIIENESEPKEWDPEETTYKELDEMGGEDDDIAGEEWKFGLEPGAERPSPWVDEGRRRWEEEQRKYDQPDERPRELDWSDREDRGNGGDSTEDDIPF